LSILIKKPVPAKVEKKTEMRYGIPHRSREEYTWIAVEKGYEVTLPNSGLGSLKINPENGKWRMTLKLGDYYYIGEREALEPAFKTLDEALYKTDKSIWMKTRCKAVLENFHNFLFEDNREQHAGDLQNLEKSESLENWTQHDLFD
jgi:hypothetical protein